MKNKIVKLIVCILFTVAVGNEAGAQQKNKVVDQVIAVIGRNIVKQSELESQYAQASLVEAVNKCDLLEELLYQKLLLAQAQKDSVEVTEAQVESELDRRLRFYIAQFGSEEKFIAFYEKSIEEFKAELEDDVRDLLLAQNIQSKITSDISVSPAEVQSYFEKIPKDSLPFINAEIEIGQILRKPPVTAEAKKEAKDKIEKLRERVLKGEDFASLAVLYSEDPTSSKTGGMYKDIQRGQFVPEFDAIAFKLPKNGISEVFETDYGYHFMQLMERKGEFVDLRHILISPKTSPEDLLKAKSLLDSVYTILKKDSIQFGDAAGKYSDDEESKNNGGLMVNPQTGTTKFEMDILGQLDPSLVFTIDKMKVGEVIKPSLTITRDGKQAYRMLYLKSRTEPHRANMKEDYQKIQAAALLEKQQDAIQDWVKKRLGSTYVKISDDYKGCKFNNDWMN